MKTHYYQHFHSHSQLVQGGSGWRQLYKNGAPKDKEDNESFPQDIEKMGTQSEKEEKRRTEDKNQKKEEDEKHCSCYGNACKADPFFTSILLFFAFMFTGAFWISTMVTAVYCCHTDTLPERGGLNGKRVVLSYGAVGISALLVGLCLRCSSSRYVGKVAYYLMGTVYSALYLWILIVGTILEHGHFYEHPFGINILVLLVLSHFCIFGVMGLCILGRSIDPFSDT
jgi:hypothetical protein